MHTRATSMRIYNMQHRCEYTSMAAPVDVSLDLRRRRDQRRKIPAKSELANRNQEKSVEFHMFCLLKEQLPPNVKVQGAGGGM